MRIAMLATASAIAFLLAIGSVSAADQFTTLNGVKAIQMSAGELSAVKGMDHHFFLTNPGQGDLARHDTDQHQDAISDPLPGKNFKMIDFPQFNPDGTPMLNPDGTQMVTTRLAAPSYSGLKNACANGLTNGNPHSGPGFMC
jgi:hypothetical protein